MPDVEIVCVSLIDLTADDAVCIINKILQVSFKNSEYKWFFEIWKKKSQPKVSLNNDTLLLKPAVLKVL